MGDTHTAFGLLHRCDAAVSAFRQSHARASACASQVLHATRQAESMSALPSRGPSGPGSLRERTLGKLQQTIEDSLGGVRDELGAMERSLEDLRSLLFQADLALADPAAGQLPPGSGSSDPRTALRHVSDQFDAFQTELLEKREVRSLHVTNKLILQTLADFSAEEIDASEFAARVRSGHFAELMEQWSRMAAVERAEAEQVRNTGSKGD